MGGFKKHPKRIPKWWRRVLARYARQARRRVRRELRNTPLSVRAKLRLLKDIFK